MDKVLAMKKVNLTSNTLKGPVELLLPAVIAPKQWSDVIENTLALVVLGTI